MRISDWSSDVCSSDLSQISLHARGAGHHRAESLPPQQSRGGGEICHAVSPTEAGDHRRGFWRLAGGAEALLRRRRDIRPHLRENEAITRMATRAPGRPLHGPDPATPDRSVGAASRSEEHTSELPSLL